MPDLPDVQEESRIVGVTLPARNLGKAREHLPYGAYQLAASYCGLSAPPGPFRGEWQHGWNAPDTNFDAEMITCTDGLSRHRRTTHTFLVARDDEEQALRTLGYTSVHAVGLPIVYQPPALVERLPGSLLVMPVHSLEYTHHQWNFDQYASEIDGLRERFSTVVACVSPSCFRRGYWISSFERRNIPVISGADIFDANTYARLARLFGRFEFMTTNGFGSHLLYAGLFGAKVSIHGTTPPFHRSDFLGDAFYQHNPSVLDAVVELNTPERLRQRFPEFFVLPWDAPARREWAAFQAGVQCRKPPDELKALLGWNVTQSRVAKAVTRRIARRSDAVVKRLLDPEEYERDQELTRLKQSGTGGQLTANVPVPGLETRDGARFAAELQTFYYGDGFQVFVNPPDGAALDLAPAEGASVMSLVRHHPDRRIHYAVETDGEDADRLDRNLARLQTAKGRVVRVPTPQAVSGVVVLRQRVTPTTWRQTLEALTGYSECRLLFLECDEPETYLASLLVGLSDVKFVLNIERMKSSSFHQVGLLSRRTVLWLALTRSGLELPPHRAHSN